MGFFDRFKKKKEQKPTEVVVKVEASEKPKLKITGSGFRNPPLSKTKKNFSVPVDLMFNDKLLKTDILTVKAYNQAQANKIISSGISYHVSEAKPMKKE